MADFSALTHRSGELYRKLFPIPCLLCGLPAADTPLCQACIGELPWLDKACQRCGLPLQSAQICGHCLHSPPIQQHSFSLLRYQAAVPRCITRFKFHQQLQFADFFAMQMAKQLQQRDSLPQCLIPIPLHPRRLRSRGFNQSLEVASRLGKTLGIACRPELLQRVRNTPSQSQLHFRERQRNIRHAFACSAAPLPTHIALIDDVMTTGQTVAEAARVLQRRGVQIIEVWTIARAISHY